MKRVWSPADCANESAGGTRVGCLARRGGLARAILVATVLAGTSASAVDVAGQSPPAAPTNVVVLADGPSASWISIFPGSSIQAAVNAYPGATTFYIRAGVHRRQRINPKTNNVFIGEAGAVLDGENITPYAFEATTAIPQSVIIKQLEIRRYASPAQAGAIQGDNGPNWVLEDNIVHDNSYIGIRTGRGWQLRRNAVYRNGVIGISGFRSHGAIIENNTIYENNWLQAPEVPVNAAASGIKFGETKNVMIRGNNIYGNLAKGVWIDHCEPTITITGNTIRTSSHQGIFIEISYDTLISNNTIENNAIGQPWPRAGITVVNSVNVEIANNTVQNNGYGIVGFQTTGVNATTGPFGPLRLQNLHVHDNIIRVGSGRSGIGQNAGETQVYSTWNNRFVHNTYTAATNSSWWAWQNLAYNFVGWQGVGQDTTGTFTLVP